MEKKSTNRYRSFCRCLSNLADAKGRNSDDKFVLSGTVQMFHLAFDLSWKVMKDILKEYHGTLEYVSSSPRETLRMAYSVGLIEADEWLELLKVRNNLAHDYDGELAGKYFKKITEEYFEKLDTFRKKAGEYYEIGKED